MNMPFNRLLWALYCVCLLAWALPAGAQQTNLLPNGSFELDPDGKAFISGVSSSTWRWFTAGDATGSATIRSAAASQGSVGVELARDIAGTPGSADSAIDKYLDQATIPAQPRIYQYLLDAKDGGVHAGTNDMLLQLQFPAPTVSPVAAYDPGAAFETFGIDGLSGTGNTLSVRVGTNPDNSSVFVDNMRVYDVTDSNRVINGGFENSASRPINWRAFSLNAGEFTADLSSDAKSGAHAVRIERTFAGAGDSDAALDLANDRIPVMPGELLAVSLAAKKVSGDDATRLSLILAQFDATGTYLDLQTLIFYNPGAGYGTFNTQMKAGATTAYVTVALRIGNNANAVRHVGAYLIDDVVVQRGAFANLIDNGSFENQAAGDLNGAIVSWRVPFTDNGNVTVRNVASAGNLGIEIAHGTGPFWLDRWETSAAPAAKPGIYKLLVDAKNGGAFGSQDNFVFEACMHYTSETRYPEFPTTCVPGANFETFGLTAPLEDKLDAGIDVRLTPSGTSNQSFYADNIQVLDVTRANRVVNGGFENSSSRLLNWRGYSTSSDPNEFTFGLSTDANSGSHALRIERTFAAVDADADAAVDLFSDRIAVLPGETLEVSLAAKKLSGDAAARVGVIVTEWDAAGALIDTLTISCFDAGTTYGRFSVLVTTAATAATLNVAFASLNDAGARHIGAYVIDDVSVLRNRPPVFTGATLTENGDQSMLLATATGWSDPDGDFEQYHFQWKLNGVAISGATRSVLARNEITGSGAVTCDVTAFDGIVVGNTIEAKVLPSQATVIEAGTANAITVDGNPADWADLSSRILPMSMYGQGGEDMLVNIRFAWNATYLYFLIEEVQDDNQKEAADQAAYRVQPWMFDAISLWISFKNGPTLLNGEFNPWFGFSSTGRTDLFTARINNQASFDETAFTGGHVATGGNFAGHNRVIEAAVKWSDLASVTSSSFQPAGGLMGAVKEGYLFGCEPLLIDNGYPGQSFRTGQTNVYPTGSDADSVDVKLVGTQYSLNAAHNWSMFE